MPYIFSNNLAESIFKKRYTFYENETWEQASKRVADQVAKPEKDFLKWSTIFYKFLSEGLFMPGGRIWYGAGRPIPALLNCFVIDGSRDSREGWAQMVGENIIIAGTGGGVGESYSGIRPRGSEIHGTGGVSSGAVSIMRIENAALEEIKSGGGRRAARMGMLNIDHPDIEEFLSAKLDLGELNNFNISVWFDNDPEEFFQKVRNNEEIELSWNNTVLKKIPATVLWDKIITNALKSGEPGVFNGYFANKMSNLHYCRKLVACNPCFPASELFLTETGYKRFGDENKTNLPQTVITDSRISYEDNGKPELPEKWKINNERSGTAFKQASSVKLTQKNSEIIELEFANGMRLKCTPDHHIATKEGMVEAKDLDESSKILVALVSSPEISILNKLPQTEEEISSVLMGLIAGDGTYSKNTVHLDFWGEDSERIYKIVTELIHTLYTNHYNQGIPKKSFKTTWLTRKLSPFYVSKTKDKTRVSSTWLAFYLKNKFLFSKETKHSVPLFVLNNSRTTVGAYYLAGLFYSDGTVMTGTNSWDIRLSQSNRHFLEQIQLVLHSNGMTGKIYSGRPAKYRDLPDGRGNLKPYWCKENLELILQGCPRSRFVKYIGFLDHPNKQPKAKQLNVLRDTYNTSQIQHTYLIAKNKCPNEDVYCIQEPVTRSIIVNGISTRRCGEIVLQNYGCCCLGSVVLSRFVKRNSVAKDLLERINWELLHKAVSVGVRFLDNVLDVTYYPLAQIREESQATRRIGLGIMGLHYFLLLLGLKYSSEEGRAIIDKVMAFIKHTAYDTSTSLAIEKGVFPLFDREGIMDSGFIKGLKPSIRCKVEQYGIRNCALLNIPPTGTTSIVMGVSSGIEPIFSPAYERTYWNEDVRNTEIVLDPLYEECLLSGKSTSHFESAADLSVEDHFAMLLTCQKHIDQSISKTINLPQSEYDEQKLSELYMKYIPNVKGLTIYPEGSREFTPLKRISEEEAITYLRKGASTSEITVIENCKDGTCSI